MTDQQYHINRQTTRHNITTDMVKHTHTHTHTAILIITNIIENQF